MVDDANNGLDPLLNEAIGLVIKKQMVSISGVQRQLRIGYDRAAKIVQEMEIIGIISECNHNNSRDVLILDNLSANLLIDEYLEVLQNSGNRNEPDSINDDVSSVENQMKREAIINKRIVIWLHDTGQDSDDGTRIYILKSYSPFEHLFNTQRRPSSIDNDPGGDVLEGYRFSATMQTRTPLRILIQHGRLEKKPLHKLPKIIRNEWEGIWIPHTRSWKDMGIDMKEWNTEGSMASQIGQIPSNGGDYLRFLIFARNIKEAKASSEEKRNMINLGRCMYGDEGTPFKDFIEDYNFSNE